MYSEKIISQNLSFFSAKEGWEPIHHSLGEVEEFTAYIKSITKIASNSKGSWIESVAPMTDKRRGEIRRWIQNEQVLCNPPEAPIWMSDYTFKPIGEIKIGDQIIGWEHRPTQNRRGKVGKKVNTRGHKLRGLREHLTKTTVLAINRRISPIVKVTMDSGQVIRCTPDHLWSSGDHNRAQMPWIPAKVGKHLRRIVDLYPNDPPDLRTAAWLGGMYDGEGCREQIGQSISHNPDVHAKLIEAMKMLDFQQRFICGKAGTGAKGYDDNAVYINGELTGKAKFAAWCKPVRIRSLEKTILKSIKAHRDKIVEVQYDGEGEVVSMKTGTGNYVAWGYASKNCSLDNGYWETRYAYVLDEGGQKRKFANRKSQEVFDSVVAYLEEQQAGIQIICLKARQVGLSTKTALKFLHRMCFIPNTLAVMASVQKEKSELIELMLDTAYNNCPFWLVPVMGAKKTYNNGSRLSIQSGMQPKGIAQGATPNCIHISEISLIPNPHNVIEEGLLPATHSNKNLFMVFEGTGSGNVGWFPDFWRSSKRDWPLGLARMCPVFISWPLATDMYPQDDWIRAHPVPAGFYEKRLEATKAHITRCESYIRNTPYLAKVVGSSYRVPIEQQFWWEFEYRQAKERHALQQHAARLPADDFEALTGVHDSVFDGETIMELEDDIYEVRTDGTKARKNPVQYYAITGHSILEEFEPQDSEIDDSKEIIRISHKNNRGDRYDWELVPLLPIDEETESFTFDRLAVYEPPKEGATYSCGVDTAHGLGKEDEDRFCASMTRVSSGSGCDTQSCELTSNRFSPAQAVPFLAAMAAWYGQVSKHYRGVKFSIEQVEGPGDTCQNQLKIMGFNYHHTPGRLDGRKVKDENKHREGWYSNKTTVPILMDRFVEAVNGGWYIPYSKWLIEELKTLERQTKDGGRDIMIHQKNKHDDRIRAAAQSYLNCHTYDDLSARAQKRYNLPSRKKVDPNEGRCLSNMVSVGSWKD